MGRTSIGPRLVTFLIAASIGLGPAATPARAVAVAVDDEYTIWEGEPFSLQAPGVLANDQKAGALYAMCVRDFGPASHGNLTIQIDGSLSYSPEPEYYGSDVGGYAAMDYRTDFETCSGPGEDSATVRFTIRNVNDRPSIAPGLDCLSITVAEDSGPYTHPAVCAKPAGFGGGQEDIFQSVLEYVVSAEPDVLDDVSIRASDGALQLTPAADAFGSVTLSVRLRDDGGTEHGGIDLSQPMTIPLQITAKPDAPVAGGDSYSVQSGKSLSRAAPGVLSNDDDVDGDPLQAQKLTDPSHGSVSLNANGSFTYTPAAGYVGSDSFTYRASDGSLTSAVTTVSLTVTAAPPTQPPPSAAATSRPTATPRASATSPTSAPSASSAASAPTASGTAPPTTGPSSGPTVAPSGGGSSAPGASGPGGSDAPASSSAGPATPGSAGPSPGASSAPVAIDGAGNEGSIMLLVLAGAVLIALAGGFLLGRRRGRPPG